MNKTTLFEFAFMTLQEEIELMQAKAPDRTRQSTIMQLKL